MNTPTIAERIELHGESYVAQYERKPIARIMRLLKHVELDAGASVADIGCGNAMLLDCIHDKVGRYVGVDFSPGFIEAAKRRRARLKCRNADFHRGSIQDFCAGHPGAFDACFALDLSEHVPDPEWAEIVESMSVCLKPGGAAYIHTPNLDFFIERMKAANFILKQFPEHVAVRDPAGNLSFFENAGFEAVTLRYVPHYNILKLVHPLSYLPGLGRFFRARLFIAARKPGGA